MLRAAGVRVFPDRKATERTWGRRGLLQAVCSPGGASTVVLSPQFRNFKIIYRRYAGLYFCICVDVNDNNLAYLEAIHNFVEVSAGRRWLGLVLGARLSDGSSGRWSLPR